MFKKEIFMRDLNDSKNIVEILTVAKTYFRENEELFNRIERLIDWYYEEFDSIEKVIGSLKTLFKFLTEKGKFSCPSVVLDDDTFQVSWRKDNSNLITLMFKNENMADYLILESSQYTDKPEITNGSKTIFKLVEDIQKLNLSYLIETPFNDNI